MTGSLAITETARLEKLEAVIEKGLSNFVQVGTALLVIRDSRLYRETHDSFDTYCRERWGMSRQNAHELIGAAEVAVNLSGVPDSPTLTSVSQARELRGLEPELAREVLKAAKDTAAKTGKPVTAAHVKAAVRAKRNGTAAPLEPPPHAPGQISDAELDAGDKGDPVWLTAFNFSACDNAQKLKAIAQEIDEMDSKTKVMAAALILSTLSPAEMAELGKRVDLAELLEASRGK